MSLGLKLKKAREMAKLSLRKVEEKTGISYSYLSNIEHGRKSNPSMEVLTALARLYNVDITYLVDDLGGINPLKEDEEEMSELLNDDLRMALLRETKGLPQKDLKKILKIIRVLVEEE